MKTISKYQIVDHGVEHSQFFTGCGTAFTEYESVYTGIGDTPFEALEDALNEASMDDWDCENIENELSDKSDIPDARQEEDDDELSDDASELYHYVSIRVK
jgi:hypothetical protein